MRVFKSLGGRVAQDVVVRPASEALDGDNFTCLARITPSFLVQFSEDIVLNIQSLFKVRKGVREVAGTRC